MSGDQNIVDRATDRRRTEQRHTSVLVRVPRQLWRALSDVDREIRHWDRVEHRKAWLEMGNDIVDHITYVNGLTRDRNRLRMAIEYLAATPDDEDL